MSRSVIERRGLFFFLPVGTKKKKTRRISGTSGSYNLSLARKAIQVYFIFSVKIGRDVLSKGETAAKTPVIRYRIINTLEPPRLRRCLHGVFTRRGGGTPLPRAADGSAGVEGGRGGAGGSKNKRGKDTFTPGAKDKHADGAVTACLPAGGYGTGRVTRRGTGP